MQPIQLKNIRLLISLCPVQVSRPLRPYPRHWKSNQQAPKHPQTIGDQIKKHRLELRWLQTDAATKIGVTYTSISNWERGITVPSRRMAKKIQDFLTCEPALIRKMPSHSPCCQTCGIPTNSTERCLFGEICKSFIWSRM